MYLKNDFDWISRYYVNQMYRFKVKQHQSIIFNKLSKSLKSLNI